jgi:hypothetical protein
MIELRERQAVSAGQVISELEHENKIEPAVLRQQNEKPQEKVNVLSEPQWHPSILLGAIT